MIAPYTQLILVNVLLALGFSSFVLEGPIVPCAIGALGAGFLLHIAFRLRLRATKRQ